MFSEMEVYDALRVLVFGALGLSFGLSFFSLFALWHFMHQSRMPGLYRCDPDNGLTLNRKRAPTVGR